MCGYVFIHLALNFYILYTVCYYLTLFPYYVGVVLFFKLINNVYSILYIVVLSVLCLLDYYQLNK